MQMIEARPEESHRFIRVAMPSDDQKMRDLFRYLKGLGKLRDCRGIRLSGKDPSCG
jgi:hypothetical protein